MSVDPFGTIRAQVLDLQGNAAGGAVSNNDWRLVVDNEQLKFQHYDATANNNAGAYITRQAFGTGLTGISVVPLGTYSITGNLQVTDDLTVDGGTLFVDASTNRVGFGTLTPSQVVHIVGNTYVDGDLTVTGNTSLNSSSIWTKNGVTNEVTYTAANVGIGTSDPDSTLHVNGTSKFVGNMSMTGHIIPTADNTYDLGSASNTFRHVYVGPGSLYVNGKQVITDDSDTITISTDINQNLALKTSGTGNLQVSTTGSGDIEFTAGGIIQMKKTLQILDGQKITSSGATTVVCGNAFQAEGSLRGTSLTLDGSNSVSASELNVLDGATAGTGVASKAVVLSSTRDISNIRNLALTGDLTVSGTTTTVNSTTVAVADGMFQYASNNAANAVDFGWYGQYVDSSVTYYSGMFRDATDNKMRFFTSTQVEPATTVDTGGTGYAKADVVVGDVDFTSGTMRGHIIPDTDDTYDIGSAEFKIRDMFVSESSLWVGDNHKITIDSGGKMKFRKRKTTSVPAAVVAASGLSESATATAALAHSGKGSLGAMKLKHWKKYMRTLSGQANAKIKDIFRVTTDDYDEEQGASSWLDSGNNVYLGASGNVGIGSNNPGSKLAISGSETSAHGTNSGIKISNTATGGGNWFLRTGATTGTYTPAGGFSIANDGGYRFAIKSDGNIGIGGQLNPAYTLDVTGNINFTGTLYQNGSEFESGGGSSVWSTSGSTATYANKVEINKSDSDGLLTLTAGQGAGASTANQIRLGYNGGKNYMHSIKTNHHSGQDSGNSIHFYVWNQGTDAAAANPTKKVFTIDGNGTNGETITQGNAIVNGSIGVGVPVPTQKLDVRGTARFGQSLSEGIVLGTHEIKLNNSGVAHYSIMNTATSKFDIQVTSSSPNLGVTDGTSLLTINSTGNVGIGNSSPTSKLHVNGSGNFTGALTVSGNATIDGNLTVSGTTTTINTTNVSVEDSLIYLASANAANAVDIGFYGKYVSGGAKYTGLIRDATDGWYHLFNSTTDPGTDNISAVTGWSSLKVENLTATGTFTGTIATAAQTNITSVGTLTGLTMSGNFHRSAHNNGFLVGRYNSSNNKLATNPIYTIGTNYIPNENDLNNMYGIGYCKSDASFITTNTANWGMYVAADGDARIWLGAGSNSASYFNTTGNFGIGTNSPSYKLHVNVAGAGSTNLAFFSTPDMTNGQKQWFHFGKAFSSYDSAALGFEYSTGTSAKFHLGFHSAGSKLTIQENGNVGINKAAPVYTLDVIGDINLTGNLRINGTPQTFGGGSSVWTEANSEAYYLGNVGIGTNNPAYKLDVNGIIQSRPAVSTSEPSQNVAYRVYTNTPHAAAQFGLSWYNSNQGFTMGSVNMSVGGGYNDCNLHFNTSKSRGTPTTKMVIDGDGNVGIGTNNPTHQLDIWHATRGEMDFNCNNTDRLNVGVNTTDGFVISENGGLLLWSSTSYVRFGAGGGEKMRILSGGNVGIGDSTPSYKLDVNGDINFTGTLRKNGTEYGAGGGSSFTKLTETITGTYGSVQTTGAGGSGNASWEGYSINGRYVFMSADDSMVGIYNDIDNNWIMRYGRDNATTGDLRLYTRGTERLRIDTNGNVGIGNSAPTNKLDIIQGSARSGTHRTGAAIYATSDSQPTSDGAIECRHANGTQGIGISYAGIYATGSNAAQDISLVPRGTGQLYVTSNMTMTGYIGRAAHSKGFLCGGQANIAATDPYTNPIYCIGSGHIPTDTTLGNMYGIGYSHNNASFLPASTNWGMYVTAAGHVGAFLSGHPTSNSFVTGNFGVGTTTPSYKLHVSGTARITGNLTCNGNITTDGILFVNSSQGIKTPTGNYGTIQCSGGGNGTWEGYSIDGRWVFMSTGDDCGLYNDVDNHWIQLYNRSRKDNRLYANGQEKFRVDNGGRAWFLNTGNHNDYITSWTTDNGKGQMAWRWNAANGGATDYNLDIYMDNNNGDNHKVGYIENSGYGTWRINDFTGQHRCIPKNNLDADKYGLIVYSTGKYVNIDNALRPTMNDSLPICDLCSTENDIRVFGVISDDRDDNETRTIGYGIFKTIQQKANINEKRIFINSVGEGGMWVCNKNGNISNGNYITPSSVPGYGVKQDSNQLLNSTVAKITCDCNFNLTPIVKQKIKLIQNIQTLKRQKKTDYQVVQKEIKYDEEINQYREFEITKFYSKIEIEEFPVYDSNGEQLLDNKGEPRTYEIEVMEEYQVIGTDLDFDSNGNVQYEDDIDANGQQQMEYEYDTRFLNADGSIIATEAEYNTKKANGENVYISCFVGCTYHCG